MEKVVVTGGLGFIGSHLADQLHKNGYSITIIDNSNSRSNLKNIKQIDEIICASILDYEKVFSAIKNARFVFHEAALVSVQQSIKNPKLVYSVNVKGTQNVLKAAKENGVQRVILASSSAIYGNSEPPLKENMKPHPLSPYAKSKLQNELDANAFYEKHSLETISLRYFNVYGSRQNQNIQYAAVIPKFITALKSKSLPIIYGNGTQTRDFIYVKDVVRANILASTANKNALGKTFNIASGKPITILSLLEKIATIMNKAPKCMFKPARKGDIVHSYADISLAKKILGFEAYVELEKGLEETIRLLSCKS